MKRMNNKNTIEAKTWAMAVSKLTIEVFYK